MLQIYLGFIFLFATTLAQAQAFYGDNWLVQNPRSELVWLTHKNEKIFILLSRFKTATSQEKFEEFFAGKFPLMAESVRKGQVEAEGDLPLNLESSSDTLQGVRFGATSFQVEFQKTRAHFQERIWVEGGTLWHLALVDLSGKSFNRSLEMNQLMGLLLENKTSSFFNLSINAYADCINCRMPERKRISELDKLIPKIQEKSKQQNCSKLPIHLGNRSSKYGIKIHEASYSSCLNGAGNALTSMKQGFLTNLDAWTKESNKQSQALGCREPKKEGSGFLASLGHAELMDVYNKCMAGAAVGSGATLIVQSLGQTARALKALYRWVKAEENPIGVMTSILASKYEGFMCLNANAQVKSICEFSTHFLAAVGVSATGAGSVAAIAKGVSAVKKLAALPPKKTLPESLAYRKVNGVSATFIDAHPFVKNVASGKADAAKVVKALRDGAILSKSPKEMDTVLKRKGFTRIDTCIKAQGECVRHKNPVTGKLEVAPMIVYVHPSGLAARLKPHGQTNAKFRPEPHGSFMLVDPARNNLPAALSKVKTKAQKEQFMNEYLGWEQELAKVDMSNGIPLPSAPSRARIPAGLAPHEKAAFEDALSGMVHFSLK